jgi:hypothetical protein
MATLALAWMTVAQPSLAAVDEAIRVTPVIARVLDAPVPVRGSDAAFHLVYEVELLNFTGGSVAIDALDVPDPAERAAGDPDAKRAMPLDLLIVDFE